VKEMQAMTPRERLLAVLSGKEPREPVICPLVDKIYASELTGRDVLSPDPVEDQLAAAEVCGYDPIIIEEWDLQRYNPMLRWKVVETREHPDYREELSVLETPVGTVSMLRRAQVGAAWGVKSPLKTKEDYRVGEWYLEQVMATEEGIQAQVQEARKRVGDRGLLCVRQVSALSAGQEDSIYHEADFPDVVEAYRGKVRETRDFMIGTAVEAGADMIFFGGSPGFRCSVETFRDEHLPEIKALSDLIKDCGGYGYYHNCNPCRDVVYTGILNEIKPSMVETLAPPPTGDIDDLREARELLDPEICTKGNLDMGILRDGPAERIAEEVEKIIDATRGYRHMVGTADALLRGTPVEHLQTMAKVTRTYG
jgi:hypothetical protein